MLLILNCCKGDKYAKAFDESIVRSINSSKMKYKIDRLIHIEKLGDLSKYSHLIISGSEASVLDDNPWDEILSKAINYFVTNERPVLGICYGHQYLARVLVGRECVRKAKKPEFGLVNIKISSNELFKNIDNPVSVVVHYDEVSYLNNDFEIIASTNNCAIHGFQYKKLPIWGIQFHPEYDLGDWKEIFDELSKTDPKFKDYFIEELDDKNRMLQNELLFKNFLKS